jgi:3D (Asp-Asp-Asp) domain-containing protein
MVVTGLEGNLGSWDKNGDGLFTPDEAASFSTANGCIDGDYNTSWDLFSKAASTFGLTCREITDSGTMLAELKAGHPVIASMGPGHFTKGGHFIVLVSVDSSGKITVNDPNSPDQKADVYDSNIVTSEAVHYWAFNNPNLNFNYKATAYDLSYDSNQKNPGDSDYGLTANGTNLVGKSIKDKARYIAVDPSLIPLGSTVYVIFPSNERFITLLDGTKVDLNGVYIAADTGGAIKGEHIDVFLGDKLNNIYPQWNNPYVHIRIIHKGS